MPKTRALRPKSPQKRGCANVPVPRDEVLESGRVPKGCRFERGGGVLCTPAVAEKHGVIEVARKKAAPAPSTQRASSRSKAASKKKASKSASKKSERSYCYSPNSKLPYLKSSLEEGKRPKLKKGCKKDPETGKICCDRPWGKRRKKAAVNGLEGLSLERFGAGSFDGSRRGGGRGPAGLGDAGLTPRPRPATSSPPRRPSPRMSLALLDDGSLDAPDSAALALLDESDDFDFAPPSEAMPRRPRPQHLREPGDFALTYFGASALAAAGVAVTYEAIDRLEYFDDKPVGRAVTFLGVGAVPAAAAWWLAEGRESADTIRTVAAAWGVTFTAIGLLGLIRELLLKQAGETSDPEDAKSLEDYASHIPFYPPHEHEDAPPSDDLGTGGEGDEIVTGGGDDPGTAGPYPYPGGRHFR